jgi:hypothetical protein
MRRERGPGRDPMKVAQYEVLGNDPKRDVRPARDDRNVRPLISPMRLLQRKQPSIVPFLLRPAVVRRAVAAS